MGRWGDGEIGRWGDGEIGRWGVRSVFPILNSKFSILNSFNNNTSYCYSV
ncbi:MAG: hypothetical protein F6K55_24235 [Moorea sp. SIO4A3]|nr:hypothetical protein [Moorena sp. SIO4A3]